MLKESTAGTIVWLEGLYVNDTIANRTHNLPACSAMPQPTVPPAVCSVMCVKVYELEILYQKYKPSNTKLTYQILGFADHACGQSFLTKTNLMHCLSVINFVTQPLNVSGTFAHQQEVSPYMYSNW
jgi:hypothetical protein